jgi:hypothetical protein
MQSKKNWTVWLLKVGLVGCPETSVTNYQPTPRNIPENRKSRFVRLFADLQIFHCNKIIEVWACYQMKGTLETARFRNIEFWGTRSTYWHTEVSQYEFVCSSYTDVHIIQRQTPKRTSTTVNVVRNFTSNLTRHLLLFLSCNTSFGPNGRAKVINLYCFNQGINTVENSTKSPRKCC